ncbi:MAG TPA: two-component sensor histidine kinase [Xanthomonadaceae bacterium]|nr:two-component sensor histidine kinase [Xanthomonadaceae bacterium]
METADDAAPARRPVARRRLRTRIILSFLLFGTGLTLLFAFATNLARQRVENQMIEAVMNQNLAASWQSYVASGGRDVIAPVQQMRAFLYRPDKLDGLRRDFPEWEHLPDGIHGMVGTAADGKPFTYKVGVRKTPDAWFFIAYDMSQATRGEQQLKFWLLVSVLLFSGLSLLIGWWSAAKVMKPVSDLARRLRAYRGRENPKPLAPHFPEDDEVGELAKALDDYSARLTEVVQRDREFNADVSHELRTPLAVIRGATELLLGKPGLDEKIHQRLLRIQRAEQQCTDLIGSLLLLSRNERGHGRTDVARVVEQLLDSHRAQLGGKAIELRMEGERGRMIDAPESALSVALGNLIGNAVKYTAEGSVTVRLLADAVEVVDTGPGLSAEDAARLFQRGYRGTHAGKTQGGGIGLSIVSRLCGLYGWQVDVRPGDARGVVARLAFGDTVIAEGAAATAGVLPA